MIAGRYALLDEIGRGGMGIVWRGEDEVLGRTVALKKVGMSPGGASPDLQRAEREARLAARLNHPHVVAVFDLATDGDEQWLVMEYVESRNLAELLRDHGPLGPDQAAALLAQAADALAAAHGAGIVHRDVKPSNILVTPTGQVKLTDFGIARANADATLTKTGLVSGSPAYLAPEVAAGAPATTASDVWAIGATLFHALEGRPPYETGGNVMGTLYQIVHEDPPRSTRAGWLAPLLEATMTKAPEDRWAMREVLATLGKEQGAGAEATQVLTEVGSAPPRPASAVPPAAPRRRVGSWLLPLLGVLALVVVLVLGWRLLSDGGQPSGGSAAGGESPAASRTPSPSSSESLPSQDAMTSFAQGYLSTATSDTRAGFDQLTPAYQAESGGYGGYRSFWGRIDTAAIRDVVADPEAMTVSYHVTYTERGGKTLEDDVTLELVQNGDGFLIDGAS